tara:strand:+ start:3150 stop:3488 length:339 start_codon:yes stop_codon:yes gene_type:complete
MPFEQENVIDSELSGFGSELLNLATGISAGVLDSENNLYILDEKKLYFGDDKEFHFRLSDDQTSVLFGDDNGKTLFTMNGDGSLGFSMTTVDLETLDGNITYRSDGLYILAT